MPGRWAGSDRRADLPANWEAVRRFVLERDKTCRCPGCLRCSPVPGGPCVARSTDADHLGDRRDHRPEMLAGKCGPCHDLKSSSEGNVAKRNRKAGPRERHPGLLSYDS